MIEVTIRKGYNLYNHLITRTISYTNSSIVSPGLSISFFVCISLLLSHPILTSLSDQPNANGEFKSESRLKYYGK